MQCTHSVSSCNASSPWESAYPTYTSNRRCVAKCPGGATPAPSSETVIKVGTPCTAYCNGYISGNACLNECGANHFVQPPNGVLAKGVCTPLTTCLTSDAPFQSQAPTNSSDRECTALCSSSQYITPANPPGTSQGVCTALKLCLNATAPLQVEQPTLTTDRVCGLACNSGEYIGPDAPPGSALNGSCQPITNCSSVTAPYQSNAPTATSDRVCGGCSAGHYIAPALPTGTSEGVCTALTTCTTEAEPLEVVRPTATTNRVCGVACSNQQYSGPVTTPGSALNGSCFPITNCTTQHAPYELTPPTSTTNRICTRNCNARQFVGEVSPANSSWLGTCTAISNCTNIQVAAPTASTDRVCGDLCPANYYIGPASAEAVGGVCHPITDCVDANAAYQIQAPTNHSNRECVHKCPSSMFVDKVTVAANTSSGVCTAITPCTEANASIQLSSPTLTTNRICGRSCPSHQFVLSVSSTVAVGGACTNVTACVVGMNYQSKAPTKTTDRVCGHNVTACPHGQLQKIAATATSNRVCSGTNETSAPQSVVGGTDGVSAGLIAGTISGVVVLASAVALLLWRRSRKTIIATLNQQHTMELTELIDRNAEREATVKRMLEAWQIPENHIKFLEKLAEGVSERHVSLNCILNLTAACHTGAFGAVWLGLWGRQTVAIKTLKRIVGVGDELDPEAAEDFRKECVTLQSIKHPCLIVFFGAGSTSDGQSFMVTEYVRHPHYEIAMFLCVK